MKDVNRRPLFIFEMANNHMGSVEHGCKIVQAMREATEGFPFHFAVKLQYRDIDSFIHPAVPPPLRPEVRQTLLRNAPLLGRATSGLRTPSTRPASPPSARPGTNRRWTASRSTATTSSRSPVATSPTGRSWSELPESAKPIIGSTAGVAIEDIDRVVSYFRHREEGLSP
jgi:hypothetical protein